MRKTENRRPGGIASAILAAVSSAAAADAPPPLSRAHFADAVVAGSISNSTLCEASGLAPSRRRGDVLWVLNDSGNSPDLFAVTTNGADVGMLRVAGAENEDWEDLASFRLNEVPYLLVADCGDNPGFRETCLLHAVPEPAPGGTTAVRPAWTIRYRYEDGPRDCESVAVDAARGRVLLLSKDSRIPALYELPLAPPDPVAVQTARRVGEIRTIPPPAPGLGILARIGSLTTAMDLSDDGRRLAVLTYEHAYLFERRADEAWAAALARPPARIELPDPSIPTVRKREALCWSADGRDLFVTGEQIPAPLLRIAAVAPPAPGAWRIEPLRETWRLRGFDGDRDLSGIAAGSGGRGMVVSDELRAAQAARIDAASRTISAGPLAPLLPGDSKAEADLEGVAADGDGRWFYVTGSHGVGKKKGDVQASRCRVFRIPVPAGRGFAGEPAASAGLQTWIGRDPVVGPFAGRPLQRNGFNIEGLAWRGGRLWFGVRAPNIGGDTFVIEADPESLFPGTAPTATLHRVRVGPGLGIRELAAVRDGFLLLTGEACAKASEQQPDSLAAPVDPGHALLAWRPGAEPVRIGSLPEGPGKAEGLLVLREDEAEIDLLVLYDGEPQGGPKMFRLHRPAP